MKALMVGMAGTAFLFSGIISTEAQDCRSCARNSATISACKICVEKFDPGKYTPKDKQIWCGKNQPACYAGDKRR
jgi:hypothetical protein